MQPKPKEYRATVALVKPMEQSTEDDQFTYVDKFFDSVVPARLWAARVAKNHPDSSGAATVHRRVWEFDEVWYIAEEDCVWSM
jgi:hypothetical protein